MLNDKAREIFAFIVRFCAEQGFGPSMREIETAFGFNSTNSVRLYLNKLKAAGYIAFEARTARSIRPLRPLDGAGEARGDAMGGALARPRRAFASRVADAPARGIPLLGSVAAGLPIEAQEDVEDHLALGGLFPSSDDLFALRVKGQSMRDRGILDGDVVVVRPQEHAREGDAVVALLGGDATVKTFRRSGEGIDLVPENPEFDVLHVGPHDDFRVLGVVVGLVRPAVGMRRT